MKPPSNLHLPMFFLVFVAEPTGTLTTRQGKEHAAKTASDAQLEALQSPGSHRGTGRAWVPLAPL